MGRKLKTNNIRIRNYNNAAWAIAFKYADEDTGEGDYRDVLYPGNLEQTAKHIVANHFKYVFGEECSDPKELVFVLDEVISKIHQLEEMLERIENNTDNSFVLEMTY